MPEHLEDEKAAQIEPEGLREVILGYLKEVRSAEKDTASGWRTLLEVSDHCRSGIEDTATTLRQMVAKGQLERESVGYLPRLARYHLLKRQKGLPGHRYVFRAVQGDQE